MVLHIYTVATEGELGIYFLTRNVIATIMIFLALVCGHSCPKIMDFIPFLLFLYAATHNLVVLYTCMVEDTGAHAHVALVSLTIYFAYYLLLMNCNYVLT